MGTQSLKEQSAAAGTIIRGDTGMLEQSSMMAENNLDKLGVETKKVEEFSSRGNCRCWIWLMMGIVILTFVGMVLMMRLFSKKLPRVEVKSQSSVRAELQQPLIRFLHFALIKPMMWFSSRP